MCRCVCKGMCQTVIFLLETQKQTCRAQVSANLESAIRLICAILSTQMRPSGTWQIAN
jgi:hypothetical protein